MSEPEMLRIFASSKEGRRLALNGAYYVDTGEPTGADIPSHDFTEEEEAEIVASIWRDASDTWKAWRSITPDQMERLGEISMKDGAEVREQMKRLAAEPNGLDGNHQSKGNGHPAPEATSDPQPDTQ